MTKSKIKINSDEIIWNVINSLLSGVLILLGAFTTGEVSLRAVITAFFVSAIVGVSKFKEYWDGEQKEYSTKPFSFF